MKKNKLFADILRTVTGYFLVLVIIVMVGIFCSGIRVVESGNVALILRFGKLVGDTPEEQIHEPGLLLAFPYIIDEVITVPTGSVIEQNVTTYFTPEDVKTRKGSYLITGDQNVAVLSASVKYSITDPVAYALNVGDVSSVINGCVSSAMLTEAAGMDVDVLLTSGKDKFAADSMGRANEKITAANVGVTVNTLELTWVSMPAEVRETYDKVNSATVEAATILENANQYRERLLPNAHSTAATYVAEANAQYSAAVSDANAALAEFWGALEEYEKTPQVVKLRLFHDKVKDIMYNIGTVRIVQDGESTILLMPKTEETDGES